MFQYDQPKIPKTAGFLPVYSINFYSNITHAYTYHAQDFCVGFIFDCKQNGREMLSKFERFDFLGNQIWDPPDRIERELVVEL